MTDAPAPRCVLKASATERVRVYRRAAWRDVRFQQLQRWEVSRFVNASELGIGAHPYRALSDPRDDGPGRVAIDAIESATPDELVDAPG